MHSGSSWQSLVPPLQKPLGLELSTGIESRIIIRLLLKLYPVAAGSREDEDYRNTTTTFSLTPNLLDTPNTMSGITRSNSRLSRTDYARIAVHLRWYL